VDIKFTPKKNLRGRVWFIGIGVSNYFDTAKKLDFAARDVQMVSDSFRRWTLYCDTIVSLIDTAVTTQSLFDLGSILERTKIEDVVIFYYSGHGVRTKDGFFLCPFETNFNDPAATGFSFESLLQLLSHAKARKRMAFLDACQSGDIAGAGEPSSRQTSDMLEFYNTYFNNLSSDFGVQVIAATYGQGIALEKNRFNNGLFTYCFIEGLFGRKASSGSPYVESGTFFPTLDELRSYLYKSVSSLSKGEQIPSTVLFDPFGNWDFQDILINF
jgi:hypothetical protein